MNLSGLLSISPLTAPAKQELGLHTSQRVTAQILAVAESTALLTIDGYPIVAQLASADQAATLLNQKTANFIVTQLNDQKVTLKMVKDDPSGEYPIRFASNGPELAVRLLEQHHIPATVSNLLIARSILNKKLPATLGLFNELQEALSRYGVWGNQEAELAAALKASGLPATAQSLALASRQTAKINDSFAHLIALFTGIAGRDLPADLLKQLGSNLQMLHSMVLNGEEETSQLAEQLKAVVDALGRSVENILLEQTQSPDASVSEKSLLSLARLQQMLTELGKNEVASAINDFLEDLRSRQFLNAKQDPIPGRDDWPEINFVVQGRAQKAGEEFSSARLRVARERGADVSKIDPASTRLMLQVDLAPNKTVEVDLSILGKEVKTLVTAPDPVWCEQAQSELPALEDALQGLGFTLKDTQINVGEPHSFERLATSGAMPMKAVDIEV